MPKPTLRTTMLAKTAVGGTNRRYREHGHIAFRLAVVLATLIGTLVGAASEGQGTPLGHSPVSRSVVATDSRDRVLDAFSQRLSTPSAAVAEKPDEVPVAASFVNLVFYTNTCIRFFGVAFANEPGAAYYDVQFVEPSTAGPYHADFHVVPIPTNDAFLKYAQSPLPRGTHFFGVYGSSGAATRAECKYAPFPRAGEYSDLRVDAVFDHATISVSIAAATPPAGLPVGKSEDVVVTATAGPGALSSVSLGQGLMSSDTSIALVSPPTGLSGFGLAAGASKSFTFEVKGEKPGVATLSASVRATASTGPVAGSGQAQLTVVPAPIVVNTTSDAEIAGAALSPPDGGTPFCSINASAAKPECSLRAAIQLVDKLGGDQTITFDIPGEGVPRIAPASPLPAVTANVTINGTTQDGGWVELSGASAADGNGLQLEGDNSSVRGLVVNGFANGAGIWIASGKDDLIAGDRIGTDTAGIAAVPNQFGVNVHGPGATIGGISGTSASACTGDCDLIAGNTKSQVYATTGASTVPFAGLKVEGDWIGVDVTGGQALFSSPDADGIVVDSALRPVAGESGTGDYPSDAAPNMFGGDTSRPGLAPGNLIDAPHKAVRLVFNQYGNSRYAATLSGNLIGLDPAGDAAVGHGLYGVSTVDVIVGGAAPGAGNVISGFSQYGVETSGGDVDGNLIGTYITGTAAIGNKFGIEDTEATTNDNVISGNQIGIEAGGSETADLGHGNLIGLARDGESALPNEIGISAPHVTIGWPDDECPSTPCDVISGNRVAGVETTTLIEVLARGAYIGTDITGTRPVPNGVGISVSNTDGFAGTSSPDIFIGGPSTAFSTGRCSFPCDIIAGNTGPGVLINSAARDRPGTAFIEGSFVGVGADGKPLPNGGPGIDVSGPTDTIPLVVGGFGPEANVLGGETSPAVTVEHTQRATTPVTLLGNLYEMFKDVNGHGEVPPIDRDFIPAPPKLEDYQVVNDVVHLSGSTLTAPNPFGPGLGVQIYASENCGGTLIPVYHFTVTAITGNFAIELPLAAIKDHPYLNGLVTDEHGNTSRFPYYVAPNKPLRCATQPK